MPENTTDYITLVHYRPRTFGDVNAHSPREYPELNGQYRAETAFAMGASAGEKTGADIMVTALIQDGCHMKDGENPWQTAVDYLSKKLKQHESGTVVFIPD
jgi:hypothetical protein